jgi:molybdopterin/thiamine biosynthesis adenylyltransferase
VSNELESHEIIKRLLDANYAISLVEGFLVVHDVPYLDSAKKLKKALLAAPLHTPTPTTLGPPFNHQMFWSGEQPYNLDDTPISLANIPGNVSLLGVHFPRNLSNKPPEGFGNYFDLVEHYVVLISGPAEELFGATAKTGAQYNVSSSTSVFKVRDTFSAKAELTDLNQLLAEEHIAIVGLGGTGSYVLDFMVKTPVKTILAFDYDIFEVHNAFRSPGETNFDDFGRLKTDTYLRKYDNFRHGLTFQKLKVGRTDDNSFAGVTFAFVCIDDGESRGAICDMLLRLGIPFIDVGMGVELEHEKLDGLIRTTLFTDESSKLAINEVPIDKAEEMDAYRTFVQIAELNAINAAVAVIKYKQLRGFYADENRYYQNILTVGSSNWIGEAP